MSVVVVAFVAVLFAIGAGVGPGWWGGMGGGHMGTSGESGASTEPVTGATEVPVRAGDLWFEPETLEVTAGDIVNVTVTNEGRIFHDFTVPDLDFMIDVERGDGQWRPCGRGTGRVRVPVHRARSRSCRNGRHLVVSEP